MCLLGRRVTIGDQDIDVASKIMRCREARLEGDRNKSLDEDRRERERQEETKPPPVPARFLASPGVGAVEGPPSMGLAWRPAGVGACHPTSLFGRLGLACWAGVLGWLGLS